MFSFQTKDRAAIQRFLMLAKELPLPDLELSPKMYQKDWDECVQKVLASEKRLASIQFWVADILAPNENPLTYMCNFVGLLLSLYDHGKYPEEIPRIIRSLHNIQESAGEIISILKKKLRRVKIKRAKAKEEAKKDA